MSEPAPRRILVVDDSEDDRAAIRRLLRGRDEFEVVEADTGAAGLEMVESERPACVLLDVYLSDMRGTDFLEALARDRREGHPVPVAMLTGRESDEVAADALERGAQDYLVKDGLTGPVLVRAIANAIEKFRIRRELTRSRIAVELRNRKLEVLRDQLQEKVSELAEATRAKDQFMAVMSHEMRTPLNAITGYADLLEMELDGQLTDGQRQQVRRIQVGSRHLLDLINDVLDLARASADKLELDLRPVDLGAVIEEVAALLESQAGEKGIELAVDARGTEPPHVEADLHRLRQVLTNLIGNAIKFTDEGSVTVRCAAADDGTVRVHVADTGIGIDPDVLPLIFSDFYQARGELTREKGGSGLGLAISQRLAKLMGGDIEAESALGEGSTFTLVLRASGAGSELRRDDVEQHAARMKIHAAGPPRRQRPEPVTVVAFGDDAEALAELGRQVYPGVRLVGVTDEARVPEVAASEKAALVVLDIASAEGAAWRVAYALQEVAELGEAAILLLPSLPAVAAVPRDDQAAGLDLGWLSLVPKPFTAAQLTHAVSTAARGDEGDAEAEGVSSFDVLVVDDDPDSRRVAAKFLGDAGLRVREAPDGESALVEMHRRPPDVVVLDLMMPVLDGFGVLATMRADAALGGVPVVVLTAKSLTPAERRFLARTAVRVLQKGEHRLADVAALVLRAAARTQQGRPLPTAMPGA